MRPLTPLEDFMLYDHPINPLNVPSMLTMNRIEEDPEEFLENILKKVQAQNLNCNNKLQKMFGKYFFK